MADMNERDSKLVQYLSEAYGKERDSRPRSRRTSR